MGFAFLGRAKKSGHPKMTAITLTFQNLNQIVLNDIHLSMVSKVNVRTNPAEAMSRCKGAKRRGEKMGGVVELGEPTLT